MSINMKKVIPDHASLIPDNAQKVFTGQIFDVYQWPQELFDGTSHTFEMLKRPDTVVAICLVDNKILVINDEQPHFGSRKSFPGGRVDSTDSDIEAAARREVAEETGYSFNNWRLIKVSQPHLKIEWFIYLFLAWDAKDHQEPNLDPGEKINVEHCSFDELKTLVFNKAGYLGEVQETIGKLNSVEQLLALPEFGGQIVER